MLKILHLPHLPHCLQSHAYSFIHSSILNPINLNDIYYITK